MSSNTDQLVQAAVDEIMARTMPPAELREVMRAAFEAGIRRGMQLQHAIDSKLPIDVPPMFREN